MTNELEVKKESGDESNAKHEVRIHIDQAPYNSTTPTTGAALYALGGIGHHHELFREVDGNQEDVPIPNDGTTVHLKQDEHFHSQKIFMIIINARKVEVDHKHLSFDEVVALTPGLPSGPTILYTITYLKGPHQNPQGSLVEGQTVTIKNGMRFNVTATDKS